MQKQLILYSREEPCPFVRVSKSVLKEYNVNYREILIDHDASARQKVTEWTGFESVPTLIVSDADKVEPIENPYELPKDQSPRGIDRGYIITEPSRKQLIDWLQKHELI